jgi:hypothetical protein
MCRLVGVGQVIGTGEGFIPAKKYDDKPEFGHYCPAKHTTGYRLVVTLLVNN